MQRVLLAVSLSFTPGCGMLFQLYAGYDEEETRTEQSQHTLLVSSLPRRANVFELKGDHKEPVGQTPVEREIPFDYEITYSRPANMLPYWLGTALDLGLVIGLGLVIDRAVIPEVKREETRDTIWALYGQFPLYLIGEVIAGAIVGGRPETISKRTARTVEYEIAVSHPGRAEVQARIEVPLVGPKLTVPLDPSAARAMNRLGSPVTLIVATSSTPP